MQQAVQARSGAEYQVIGDPVTPPQVDSKPISVGARVHRALIQGAYVADLPYSALKPGHSLLPRLHFELGVKPSIRANLCTECGDCVPVCPVDAIDVPAKRIIADRCECLRCLKCVSVCPEDAIEVRGWRRPS